MPPSSAPFSQLDFAAKLFDPEATAPSGVVDPNGVAAPKRYSVYKNNVVVSYLEALAAAYPACKNLIGEAFFNAIGRAYLKEVPPSSQLMILFGEGFADFVADYQPAQQVPFLPYVARLERAWRLAYHSADIAPITPQTLSALPPEQLGDATIAFLPSVSIVSSPFPVLGLWTAATKMQALDGIDPQHGEAALIVRPNLDVNVINLPPEFAAPVIQLITGCTLNEAAETGLKDNPDFDFAAMFGSLIQSGAIANIKLDQEGTQ